MRNFIKIAIILLMLGIAMPSYAQFGRLLNKAKEKLENKVEKEIEKKVEQSSKTAVAKATGDPKAEVAAEAASDLPAIYSIAKMQNTYGPDSDLDNVLYPQLAYSLQDCLGSLKKGEIDIANTTWDYQIERIMSWVQKRDMKEDRLKAWTAEYTRVKKLLNKALRGDAPEPTGDKKADAYNYMLYNIDKAKNASDRKVMKDFFTTGAISREIYIKNDVIAESDPKYKEVYNELVNLRAKLEPYGFDNLVKVATFAESKAKWKETKESVEAQKYNLIFADEYNGSDGAELKKLAQNAVNKRYNATKILHSNFKHGWVTNEERTGQSVSGHNKKCRIMVYFTKDKKYYSCETFFKMRAPVGGKYTKTDWPGLTEPIEVPGEVFTREFKKAKK